MLWKTCNRQIRNCTWRPAGGERERNDRVRTDGCRQASCYLCNYATSVGENVHHIHRMNCVGISS